ncbi:carbohydrate-binding family 9-like protein [Pinibacter sp. MAH-24]|uniref:Carbohydrate-binding family 9-like protein n=2 Tax=Pinibacter soli TaxID=3044211 RepID=A0ABT6REL9_9BACT|nr:carbohydrate-binding family 9-like protein [Pinibacter soli]
MDVARVKEKIKTRFVPVQLCKEGIKKISDVMDGLDRHTMKYCPWKEYGYAPEVSFSIAHSHDCIYLKYFVKEKEIRAHANQLQGPVWEDACVEFFVSFDGDGGYYNFEFNCLGTFLAAFGPSKTERKFLEMNVMKQIVTHASIIRNEHDDIQWELAAAIPVGCFAHSSIGKLNGISCDANFYKCGDLLIDPHFVAWSDIESPVPNFHLPEYFGMLEFN